MKYTIQKGVERPFLGRISDNARFLLPLLVILAGVLLFLLYPNNSSKRPNKPLTLGIYTVKTSDQKTSSKPGSNTTGNNGGNSDLSGSGQSPGINPQLGGFSPVTAVAPPTSSSSYTTGGIVGGMGGGGGTSSTPITSTGSGGGSGGGTITPPPPPPPTSTGSIVCTDLLTLSQVCTACTPPLILQPGQKALLYTNGSCVAVN